MAPHKTGLLAWLLHYGIIESTLFGAVMITLIFAMTNDPIRWLIIPTVIIGAFLRYTRLQRKAILAARQKKLKGK